MRSWRIHRRGTYAELESKVAEISAANDEAAAALKDVERRLGNMAVLIKNLTTYKQLRPVVLECTMNLLEVKNICKTYGSGETAVKALKDVSFSVPKGEYVAVVGESGSGKSTLLNMIGALDTPTTGKVLIDGKDIFAMDERKLTVFRRRNIGFIFQAFNLVPELTVEQNIIFPVLLDYQKPDKKYLEELLAVLNLKERRNHLPSQLSGGQQQRVAIGRALITRPALILADEPTGNLDTQNSSEVIALLKEASKKYEQTIIMITHNRSIAQTADRVLQVSDGNLTDFGRCRE